MKRGEKFDAVRRAMEIALARYQKPGDRAIAIVTELDAQGISLVKKRGKK